MNFLAYPPTAWQFDRECGSFIVVCVRDRQKQRQTEEQRDGEWGGEKNGRGGTCGREGEMGEGGREGRKSGEGAEERERTARATASKRAHLQSLLKNVPSLSGPLSNSWKKQNKTHQISVFLVVIAKTLYNVHNQQAHCLNKKGSQWPYMTYISISKEKNEHHFQPHSQAQRLYVNQMKRLFFSKGVYKFQHWPSEFSHFYHFKI